jgi:hypothetical protein
MRTWTAEAAGVRSDPSVAAEVAAFIAGCRVERMVEATGSSTARIRKASITDGADLLAVSLSGRA